MPAVVLLSLPFLGVLLFAPVLRRLAFRNAIRRPREAALVVLGSLLGTAILTGSFVVGDTLEASLRRSAYDQLGPIDEVVAAPADKADEVGQRLDGFRRRDVDGVLPMTLLTTAVATPSTPRRASPRTQLVEVDFREARAFGDDPAATGIQGATPGQGQTVVSDDLARALGVGRGDDVEVFAFGRTTRLRVLRLLPRRGVAGFALGLAGESRNMFVAPGTIAAIVLDDARGGVAPPPIARRGPFAATAAGSSSPQHVFAVSNAGGVEDGADHSIAVRDALRTHLDGTGAQVTTNKRDVLRQAEQAGAMFSTIFTAMASFGVIAGILLLVNIFVMLAEERRSELGMLRAIGMRRSWLVLAFSTEGWFYALVSATTGAIVGVALGNVVANLATGIFAAGSGSFELNPVFAAKPASVQRGFAAGFVIALVTVVLTSVRLSRFNVIHAIRDLDETSPRRTGVRGVLGGVGITALGAVWFLATVRRSQPVGMLVSPMVIAAGVAVLAGRVVARRAVVSAAAVFSIAWGVFGLRLFRSSDADAGISVFVLQGVVLTAAAIVLVSQNQDVIGATIRRLGGGSKAMGLRLGLAYPLARRFRTGMTLAMYTLVMFMLTFITTFSHMAFSQIDRFSQSAIGGFDVVVSSSPTNPVPPDELAAREGVDGVAKLDTVHAETVLPGEDSLRTLIAASYDERWVALGPPTLGERGSYASDEDAYRAVLADPGLIIVNPQFLAFAGTQSDDDEDAGPRGGFGAGDDLVKIGDTIELRNPLTGNSRDVRVAALSGGGFGAQGALYGAAGVRELLSDRMVGSSLYVALDPGVDAERFASEVSGSYVENGAEGTALASQIAAAQSSILGFFGLVRGYLALGLIVGIAGLGVVMVRAVRERRRQIGVLRALGFEARTIRRAFVIESGFVALEGVLSGVVLALITAYSVVALSSGFGGEALQFSVPLTSIVFLVTATLVASLLATAFPSQAASRIRPAVALRIAD